MKFALFLGCNIPARVGQYERSARAVLDKLDIDTVDIFQFKCCGNPIRNTDGNTFIRMAARNLALAEQRNVDVMVLCKCCFGSLKKAAHLIRHNPEVREQVNAFLAREGLQYTGAFDVKHFLTVLYHEIGMDALKAAVTRPYKGLKIATHYGCHALRPSNVTEFDNPVAPVLFDDLVAATGALSIDWQFKLDCCGAPLLGVNDQLSTNIAAKKLAAGKRAGADYLCVACPYCQMQFDAVQKGLPQQERLPTLLYPQLLGLAMGIGEEALGLKAGDACALSAA